MNKYSSTLEKSLVSCAANYFSRQDFGEIDWLGVKILAFDWLREMSDVTCNFQTRYLKKEANIDSPCKYLNIGFDGTIWHHFNLVGHIENILMLGDMWTWQGEGGFAKCPYCYIRLKIVHKGGGDVKNDQKYVHMVHE